MLKSAPAMMVPVKPTGTVKLLPSTEMARRPVAAELSRPFGVEAPSTKSQSVKNALDRPAADDHVTIVAEQLLPSRTQPSNETFWLSSSENRRAEGPELADQRPPQSFLPHIVMTG